MVVVVVVDQKEELDQSLQFLEGTREVDELVEEAMVWWVEAWRVIEGVVVEEVAEG